MNSKYKFTIFTSCYNSEKFIHRLYDSLKAQSFKNFEWLIIDDFSDDSTKSIIESIERSEFPGIYKVYYGDIQPLYVSESGNYFMFGQMFKIDSQNANKPVIKNITDKDLSLIHI